MFMAHYAVWKHIGWPTTANPEPVSSAKTSVTVSATGSSTASSAPTFSIKIMSEKKKSEHSVQNLHFSGQFASLDALKQGVLSKCADRISIQAGFGYIEPGHGVNGKKRWLMSHDDLQEMYSAHEDRREILLWSYACTSKRPRSPDVPEEGSSAPKRSRYYKQIDKLREVDEIEEELRSKNAEKYTEEQIRMWAHLIHMKKHTSYDEPPNKRFWKSKSSATGSTGAATSGATGVTTCASGVSTSSVAASKSVSASPGKRVNLRGQCIDQLLRLQQLFDNGGLTQEQYTEMKEGIMNEMKMFD